MPSGQNAVFPDGSAVSADAAYQQTRNAISPVRLSPYGLSATCALSDFVIVLAAALLPLITYVGISGLPWEQYAAPLAAVLVLYPCATYLVGAYRIEERSARDVLWRGLTAVALTFTVVLLLLVGTKTTDLFSRVWFFSWMALTASGVAAQRILAFAVMESRLAAGACLNRALVLSTLPNGLTEEQVAAASSNRTRAAAILRVSQLTEAPRLAAAIQRYMPDTLIVEVPWAEVPAANAWLREATRDYALKAYVVPASGVASDEVLRMSRLGSHVMFQTMDEPISGSLHVLKRLEDLVLASAAVLLLTPLFLTIALAIKLESRGPVFFRQVRAGFNGSHFYVWKFRSMYTHMSDAGAAQQTRKGDRRVTAVGRFIRRISLDELPQLFNVIGGTMSLVGPRPHALQTMAGGHELTSVEDRYAARHRVRPGITGWAQVNGYRGELDTIEKLRGRVEYDIYYIENWSLMLDIKILLMTALKVIYDPNAY